MTPFSAKLFQGLYIAQYPDQTLTLKSVLLKNDASLSMESKYMVLCYTLVQLGRFIFRIDPLKVKKERN